MSRWVFGVVGSFRDMSLPAPKRAVIWQCKAASLALSLSPSQSPETHLTPLSTLVGDHIWLGPASGTPTMVCKILLHQPLMAFEEAWLLTTRDSWIATERRKGWCEWQRGESIRGSGLPYSETVLYFHGSTFSLTRSSQHLISWPLLSIFITKTTVKARGLMLGWNRKSMDRM